MRINWRAMVAVALGAGLLGGCAAGPGKYDVAVRPAEGLRDGAGRIPSFEVDLVGVNPTDAERLRSYSVSDYFSGSDPVRADADRKTLAFTAAKPGPQTLSLKDPVWKTWSSHGATELVVLANIPGVGGSGPNDRRRLVLPLSTDRWKGSDIEIEIQRSGVVCRTPMNPEK
ncbi:MAG: hypothetical protein WD749_03325 [Phycisphaerales bacterium]